MKSELKIPYAFFIKILMFEKIELFKQNHYLTKYFCYYML